MESDCRGVIVKRYSYEYHMASLRSGPDRPDGLSRFVDSPLHSDGIFDAYGREY